MTDPLPIWNPKACVPRDEILSGALSESELALNLSAVIKGIAKPPYDNPKSFFEATYQTKSMKEIISDVMGRLSGAKPDVNPIILLDVGFGGGKTHTLVTLYYAAKHNDIPEVKQFLENNIAPSNTRVIALSGDEYGGEGIKRDAIQIKTIWGDIFYQLGKYEKFKNLDQEYKLPSLDDIREAIDGPPVLILLDELPSYMKTVHDQEYLLDKAVQFIQRLVIAVSEKNNAVLTVAIAEDTYKLEATKTKDAIISTVKDAMTEAKAHIKRKERIVIPIQIEDVVHILNRRLFKSINPETATSTAKEYLDLYSNLPVPDKMKRNSYKEKIQSSYPFHPELIDVLYQRLATLDRFQNTRGALRILSSAVKRIWTEKEKDATLIHPFHIDLADESITNDLTQGIGENRLKNAIEGDIWNSDGTARAQELDEQYQSHWDAPLVRRVCNTIFLYSLVGGKDIAKGIESNALASVSVTPIKEEHFTAIRDVVCEKILLDQPFQFVDKQGTRFVFVKEAPPLKVIDMVSKDVMQEESTRVIQKHITTLFGKEGPDWMNIEVFTSSPQEFFDEPSIRVAILNPNSFSLPSTRAVSKDIENFLKYKDNHAKKLREFINSAFLLVASHDRLNALHLTAQKIVAADKVRNDLTYYNIQDDRKSDVEAYLTRQLDNIHDSIRAAFVNLIFYDKDGIKVHAITSSGYSKAKNGADMLALQLTSINRINDQILDPSYYVMEYAWPKSSPSVTVKNLFDTFHQVPGLEIPATKELFIEMVKKGIETDEWILKENEKIFTHKNMPHYIQIDNSSELVLLKEAEKRGYFEEKPQIKCEKCGSNEHVTSQHESGKGPTSPPPLVTSTSHAWTDASLDSLTSDLDTFMKREHFDKVTWIKLQMSEKQIYLASIKNFLTKMAPDRDLNIKLDVKLVRPISPNYELTFVITRDDINTDEGKSILDLSWKLKGVEHTDISLELTWEDGISRDKAINIIKSLGDGSTEQIDARMDAKMSREVSN